MTCMTWGYPGLNSLIYIYMQCHVHVCDTDMAETWPYACITVNCIDQWRTCASESAIRPTGELCQTFTYVSMTCRLRSSQMHIQSCPVIHVLAVMQVYHSGIAAWFWETWIVWMNSWIEQATAAQFTPLCEQRCEYSELLNGNGINAGRTAAEQALYLHSTSTFSLNSLIYIYMQCHVHVWDTDMAETWPYACIIVNGIDQWRTCASESAIRPTGELCQMFTYVSMTCRFRSS